MPEPLENYALIGDCRSAALVGRTGSIDWLCMPRFDSASLFARILGDETHGHWSLNPVGAGECTSRQYEEDTFILVTRWVTESGEVEVIDSMPHGDGAADVARRVVGISGEVVMEEVLRIRFDYADAMPWVRQAGTEEEPELVAIAGPDAVIVRGPHFQSIDHAHRAEFTVRAGETVDTVLTWFPSHKTPYPPLDLDQQLADTRAWWQRWARACREPGAYDTEVRRSLLVLRALTHETTGGIVAAPTTSLPEDMGGSRNWDYRYVWLRDAALTLEALMLHGYEREAHEWRDWLLRAIAGDPEDVQIMYGLSGERRLDERELPSLPGYRGSSPVRKGNGAYTQFQGDIFGEVMIALEDARDLGVAEDDFSWSLQVALLEHIAQNLDREDNGIWEIRGPHQRFTHSRAMIWAAFDRGIAAVRTHGLRGPVERWELVRAQLGDEIERLGFNAERGHYVQHYATTEVDASLLQLAQIGYVAYDDPRMLGTVAEIERTLLRDGLPLRYRTESGVDGLEGDEHPFLTCAFWLVEQYARSGRLDDAVVLMDRLVGLANDVGLLSEEYDTVNECHMGNTPQALSHLSLVRAADSIAFARQEAVSA
ncbi:MAG: glycoside hydrolase family 15 protein [Actinobacteria bacterium]|nr:glycoside hydrolase family 15 protein [Actinomycetota bacterium]MBU1608886.1 glycoside hydrolase family 15 protein [Actinomycetota bacterium]MBU2314523.1 glycoside hydrolase family 15 protein [Actinomycetota bacterium]MBU2384282.1 glycoside hydrolase family 15 protein [Actinomycetota bacterium]